MSRILWVFLGVLFTLSMTALGDMVSEEVRDRLDHLPHAVLRLAAQRLDPAQRVTVYDAEWMPELTYILKGDDARPITRLFLGTWYALGILAVSGRLARQLDADREQLLQAKRSHRAQRDREMAEKLAAVMMVMEDGVHRAVRWLWRIPRPLAAAIWLAMDATWTTLSIVFLTLTHAPEVMDEIEAGLGVVFLIGCPLAYWSGRRRGAVQSRAGKRTG